MDVQEDSDCNGTGTQTDDIWDIRATTECDRQLFSVDKLTDDAIHHYTGLTCRAKFDMVLETLGEARFFLNYHYTTTPSLSIPNQFLLTLIKLRTHPPHIELAINFNVSEKQVSNVFLTWINFMYYQWKEIEWWPSSNLVKFFMPKGFRQSYPKTRVIIDGTECPAMKPKCPTAQQATFSSYKNRNTAKVVVGASPSGLVSFISDAYGGSASDRQIIERSALCRLMEAGDEIMADKGFNCDDLFIPYHVCVNIPTFFKNRNRLSAKTVARDRRIASKRVHIERIIGLAKTYKILCQPLNPTETTISTQIITVCFLLCNFRQRIVSHLA